VRRQTSDRCVSCPLLSPSRTVRPQTMTAAATTCITMSTVTPVGVAPGKAPAAPSLRSHRSAGNDSSRTPRAIQRKRYSGRSERRRRTAKTAIAPSAPAAVKKMVGPGPAKGGNSIGMSRVATAAQRTAEVATIDPTSALSPATDTYRLRHLDDTGSATGSGSRYSRRSSDSPSPNPAPCSALCLQLHAPVR